MKTVYIVATIQRAHVQGDDVFADIVLVTEDIAQAKTMKKIIKERRPYPGLDYNLLAPYEDVIWFERELGSVVINKETDDEQESKGTN
jgi:hypothetical protein